MLSAHLAADAAKKLSRSNEPASKIKSMYGAQDTIANQSVPSKIPPKKGVPQGKRSRDDKTLSATVEPPQNKVGHGQQRPYGQPSMQQPVPQCR